MDIGRVDDRLPYYEDRSAGSGTLPARAWYAASDAARLSLNGAWAFRLSDTAEGTGTGTGFAADEADTGGWDRVTVPGHWVLQGHGAPAYTNSDYPFPVDPPRVPTENPTGDHRRVFDLPEDWPVGGESVLRFDGVESCCATPTATACASPPWPPPSGSPPAAGPASTSTPPTTPPTSSPATPSRSTSTTPSTASAPSLGPPVRSRGTT